MKIKNRKMVVVIPAFEPTQDLLRIADEILENPDLDLVIVNDGSSLEKKLIFRELREKDRVKVLQHKVNLGKGAALKTAFHYILKHKKKILGVVTADADGQHLTKDI